MRVGEQLERHDLLALFLALGAGNHVPLELMDLVVGQLTIRCSDHLFMRKFAIHVYVLLERNQSDRALSNSCAGSPLPDGRVDSNSVVPGYTHSGSAIAPKFNFQRLAFRFQLIVLNRRTLQVRTTLRLLKKYPPLMNHLNSASCARNFLVARKRVFLAVSSVVFNISPM